MKMFSQLLVCNYTTKESCIQVINFCIHRQASCFMSRIILNMALLLHVVSKSENLVVNQVVEEVNPPIEVGFDIYGTSPEPDYSVNQGKLRVHLNLSCVLQIISLLFLNVALSDYELSGNLIDALPTLFFHINLITSSNSRMSNYAQPCLDRQKSGDYLSPARYKWIFGYDWLFMLS